MEPNLNLNTNPFKKFTRLDQNSNRDYVVNAYKNEPKIQYYNDTVEIQNKTEEKKKKNKFLTMAFSIAAGIGIIGTLAYEIARGKINLKYLTQKSVYNVTNNNTTQAIANSKAGKTTLSFANKAVNGLVNFSNMKDDLWLRFTDKVPFLKHFDNFLENMYDGFAKKKYKAKYDANLKILQNNGLLNNSFPSFDEWFNQMKKSIKGELITEGKEHISKGLANGSNIKDKAKNLVNNMTGSVISNDRLQNIRTNYLEKLEIKDIGIISDDLYSKNPDVANNAFNNLVALLTNKKGLTEDNAKEVAKAIKEFNSIKLSDDLFDRLRDNTLGNASTDTLTLLTSLGLLGGTIATSDNKEERKSTMINLGIPLLTTLATMVIGTANCLSGLPALIFGLVTGEIASRGANKIDTIQKQKTILKAQKEQETIYA